MPSVIPYDPSLVLGNLVSQEKLDNLTAISALQAPVDVAEDTLNSLIALKRSIDMTVEELIDMQIDATDLVKESKEVGKQVKKAAVEYAKAKLNAEKEIQPLKVKLKSVSYDLESPIDYNKSAIKKDLPLAADSLKMNVQYFAFDENRQSSSSASAAIKGFVSGELDDFGDEFKVQASSAIQSQVNSQYSRHSVAGTLVISISCTHKNALLFAPFILNVDKAIRVWNRIYTDDMIKTDSRENMAKIAQQSETKNEKFLTLLSGATYGSCFIGMVHILNTTTTQSSETMYAIASSLQSQFNVGASIAHASGGFGIDTSFANNAKNLLSSQNISSHCTLVTMGSIPTIKSNEVNFAIQKFASEDGESPIKKLVELQNATAADKQTIDSAANAARTGQQMITMQSAKVEAVLTGLAKIDEQANKMLDINSMMDAMDDYIAKALAGNIGVPINYYLKPITKSQLAEMWIAKYYPGRYLTVSGDDSEPGGGNTTNNTSSGSTDSGSGNTSNTTGDSSSSDNSSGDTTS